MEIEKFRTALHNYLKDRVTAAYDVRVLGYRENIDFLGYCPTCADVDYTITIFYEDGEMILAGENAHLSGHASSDLQYVVKEYFYNGSFTELVKELTEDVE